MKLILVLCSFSFAMPNMQDAARTNAKTKILGERLYQYDMASAFASDIMTENWKNYGKYSLNGYLTIRDGKQWRIIHTGEKNGKPCSFYEVLLRKELGKSDTSYENDPPRPLIGNEISMYMAERTANGVEKKVICSKTYNKILVSRDTGWSVYYLAATTENGKVVLGGHYRVDMDITGTRIVDTEQFTNSCLEMPYSNSSDGVNRLAVTPLRSDLPTEIHYYLTLLHNLEMYVAIKNDMWFLKKDVIVYLGELDKMKPLQK